MSRFDKAELEGVIENMEKLLQEETASLASGPVPEPSHKDGAGGGSDAGASEPVCA
jgi:hypothetical protein